MNPAPLPPPLVASPSRLRSAFLSAAVFTLGLAVGSSAVWKTLRHPALVPPNAPVSPSVVLPSWSWRASDTPPALIPDDAAAAVAAWSALRDADGSAAAFATRADALHALLVRLSPEAFPRLLATLAPDRSAPGLRLLDIGFDAWVEVDPAAATRWAVAANPRFDDLAVRGIRAWSSQAAEEASAWACSLEDSGIATRLAGWALGSLAKQDPTRALALANSRDDAFRAAVFRTILGPLSKADPAATVRAYGPLIWNNGEGFSTLDVALQAWAQRDPPSAISWLCSQPQGSDTMLAYRISQLARLGGNREAIATAVATNPNLPVRHSVLVNLLSDWQNEKPAETLAWLKNLNDPDRSAQLLLDAMNRSTPAKPELALTIALGLPEGDIRTEKIGRTLAAWAGSESAAALAWINAHPEPGVAAAAADVHATLLAEIARDEPATAVAEWTALTDPRSRAVALLPLAKAWGESDPAAALVWYAEQTAALGTAGSESEIYSLNKHIHAWAQKAPDAALRWAENLATAQKPAPGSTATDWARLMPLFALAGDINQSSPRLQTADLYAKIKDPGLRAEVLTRFVNHWLTTDPASAKTWVENSSAFSPAEAAALLAPVK